MKENLHTTEGTRPWKDLGGGVRRRIRSYDPTLMLVEVAFEEGAAGAMHTHPHRQLTYCLSGAFRFTVEDEEVRLDAGDSLIFPDGAPHGCVALEAGVLLDVFTPVREDFLSADGLAL